MVTAGQTSYTTPEMGQILEAMIDSERLHYVLEVLGRICSEKSDHIMASYGDKPLADKWAMVGSDLSLLSGKYYNQLECKAVRTGDNMQYIHKLIEEKKRFISEAEDFKAILIANLDKKVNKRHLGSTPVPYYNDADGPTFKFYLKNCRSYLQHHNPPIARDIEQTDRDIGYAHTAIKKLRYLLEHQEEMKERRQHILELQEQFETALNELMSNTCYLDGNISEYCNYFGVKYREGTGHRREY